MAHVSLRGLGAALLVLALVACGDNLRPSADAAPPIDARPAICGNGMVEGDETCDDGDQVADAICGATCQVTCGNGSLDTEFGELCDPGVTSGPGACPASCDDAVACTDDVRSGADCQVACVHSDITVPVDGDGCCPAGANANNDDDCAPVCGNSVVEMDETCDRAISGGPGACPLVASCNDLRACTTDTLVGAGTCTAACTNAPVTQPMNGDGCCAPGGLPETDDDCVAGCGNGTVDSGEACDTGIASGTGACPISCSDGIACTRDVLVGDGSCAATCTFPAITVPINSDGCCPAGANANTDSDCTPRCGNAVVETGEACDDGNTNNTDACSNTCTLTTTQPTAFRLFDLDLRDPHVFVDFLGCRDVTDTALAGFSVNGQIQTAIQTDGTDSDLALDLSIVALFRPLTQAPGASTPLQIHFPTCTAPVGATVCSRTPAVSPAIPSTATNSATGPCGSPMAGTLGSPAYTPSIVSPAGPCYQSGGVTVTVQLAGIPVTLRDARIAATYVGNPASTTVNGLLLGFISETDANATTLPSTIPLVGGQPLSSLLPGGMGNCSPRDDRDMNGGIRGWWFYLNFVAPRVTWFD